MDVLSERAKKILGAIVKDYILTAEPVGSKAIATRYSFGLSPATIRNIMAELEREGFLVQPHTSAGRIPTEKSFRFYVDTLLEPEEPNDLDKEILNRCSQAMLDIDGVFMETTKALSTLTGTVGIVFVPGNEGFIIRQIKLMPLDSAELIVLLVSTTGTVKPRIVRLGVEISTLNLERITNYLNSIGSGLTVRGLRARIASEMKKEKNLYDELFSNALKLGVMALNEDGSEANKGLYVEGKTNMLEQPEFRDDFDRMKKLFAAFEEKSLLVMMLDKCMEEDGIHIYMGSESRVKEFEGLSFVTAPYIRFGDIYGTLGVIGPVRMNYSKIVPLVAYTAGLLSKAL